MTWAYWRKFFRTWGRRLFGPAQEPLPRERRFSTVAFDGVRWHFPAPLRIVAVGDLQGDLQALAAIGVETKLIDEQGRWIGADAHWVLVGDLVGGHEDSRLLLNFLLRLEPEARAAGGAVHALLGNHDLLPVQGDLSKWTRRERKRFKKAAVPGAPTARAKDAFRGMSVYARWTRARNTLLQLGTTLFVHAAVDEWALTTEPGRINATVRAWITHWQGLAPVPDADTRWSVGIPDMKRNSRWATGPLWNRSFKARGIERPSEGVSHETLTKILTRWGVERLIVGHAPVADGKILLAHPYYGERVVMIDTRISDAKVGRISALELRGDTLSPLYFAHAKAGKHIREQEQQALISAQHPQRPWYLRWWD